LAPNEVVRKIGSELDLTSIFTPPHLMTFQVMKERARDDNNENEVVRKINEKNKRGMKIQKF